MENNQRITSSLKKNSPGSHEITIMIMGSTGRIRSFTISRRILLWSSLFLSFYILLSLFIISRFVDIRFRFRAQSARLEKIEEKYEGMEKDLLKARQRTINLEAYIESTRKLVEEGSTNTAQPPDVAAVDKSNINAAGKVGEQAPVSVDVEGLDIRRLNSGVVIDFRLVNMASGVGAIEGYMHIIVSDQNNNFPSIWNAPSKEFRNGLPLEFRSGEHFIIQRFKQYHREFTSDSSFGTPARIRILVYDLSGNLIFTKEYEVKHV